VKATPVVEIICRIMICLLIQMHWKRRQPLKSSAVIMIRLF
jgi:hypothetical protein